MAVSARNPEQYCSQSLSEFMQYLASLRGTDPCQQPMYGLDYPPYTAACRRGHACGRGKCVTEYRIMRKSKKRDRAPEITDPAPTALLESLPDSAFYAIWRLLGSKEEAGKLLELNKAIHASAVRCITAADVDLNAPQLVSSLAEHRLCPAGIALRTLRLLHVPSNFMLLFFLGLSSMQGWDLAAPNQVVSMEASMEANMEACTILPDTVAMLADVLPRLQMLKLHGEQLQLATLQPLTGLQQLTKLDLAVHDMGPAEAASLAGLTRLRDLQLQIHSRLTDDDRFGSLGQLHRLTKLQLSTVGPMPMRVVRSLEQLSQLASLGVAVARDEFDHDATWTSLGQLQQLTELHMASWGLSAAALQSLEQLSQLASLHLVELSMSADAIQRLTLLGQLQQLTALHMKNIWRLSPAVVQSLEQLSGLVSLNLEIMCLSAEDTQNLAVLRQLRHLTFVGSQLTMLGQLQQLTELHVIAEMIQLSADAVQSLEHLSQLVSLDLDIPLSAEATQKLTVLGQLQQLQSLILRADVPACGVQALARLSQLETLELTSPKLPQCSVLTQLSRLASLYLGFDTRTEELVRWTMEEGVLGMVRRLSTAHRRLRHVTVTDDDNKHLWLDANVNQAVVQRETWTAANTPGLVTLVHPCLSAGAAETARLFESSPDLTRIGMSMMDLRDVSVSALAGLKMVELFSKQPPCSYPIGMLAALSKLPKGCQLAFRLARALELDATASVRLEQDCKEVSSVLNKAEHDMDTLIVQTRDLRAAEQGFSSLDEEHIELILMDG